MDRLTSMAVFVKTADSGSFAAAALAFGISSQMAGKHVSMLEERVGARLLNRTTRRQSLTEIGRIFYERCKALLADAQAAESVAQELSAAPRGRLRITAPVTFGACCLAPMIARYLQAHPEVRVELTLADRFIDLIDEAYEAAIRLGALSDSTLIARPLMPYRLVACASPAYLAERGEPLTPQALTAHECLAFVFTSMPAATEWRFTDDAQREHVVPVSGRFEANDVKALLAAALNGAGIILAPEVAVRDELAAGRLVRLLNGYEAPPRPMHLVFPASRVTPKLRAFIDQVVAEFGPAGT
ncbi:LysR family transcriptional regulator [Paraburkholderia rhynchosiae]|uniref:HTH-type transcriptional regulator DmlR n=1 Tax=Paraburkholderia rhynchosiae TaxID=487049 RepID=A0A2N7W624_9BURK|nr:LysR family transcriptional regulator [Paraburkholderia rhynchosiae]PMS24854.1 LysR family transcriptional regulator [Paraburkholderia rhynchosiae]CAB3725116.1 HTH-type transcriptional regulator DmlR [Paraburkholderia rhynchosiae]